jgi:hypothetical protein
MLRSVTFFKSWAMKNYSRHENCGQCLESTGSEDNQAAKSGTNTCERKETTDDSQRAENKSNKLENPAEAPQVVVICACCALCVGADKNSRHVIMIPNPGVTYWQCWDWLPTVLVILTAHVKVCPLSDGARIRDLGEVGLEEVDFIEGRDVFNTCEDDEKHHN